jgi:hypothetical protein
MRFTGKRSISSFLKVCLNVAWYAGFVVIVAVTALMVVFFVIDPTVLSDYMLRSKNDFITLSSPGIKANWPITVMNDFGALGWNMASGLVNLVFVQAITYQLRKIVAGLSAGEIFKEGYAERVRAIGLLVLAGALVNGAVSFLLGSFMVRSISLQGASLSADFSLDPGEIFLGLVLIVLGEIFRCGAAMKAEADLTI